MTPDPPGGNLIRLSFYISGQTLDRHQELDTRFDPALFSNLTNATVGPSGNFNLKLLQPNNPPGAFGDYSIVALQDSAPWTGPFAVTVTYYGLVPPPASLPLYVNQLDSSGAVLWRVDSGFAYSIPEPGLLPLAGIGIILCVFFGRSTRQRERSLAGLLATNQAEPSRYNRS